MTSSLYYYKSSRVKQQFDSIQRALQASLRTPASSNPHDFLSVYMTHIIWLIKCIGNSVSQDRPKINCQKVYLKSKDTFQNDMFLTFLTNWSRTPHIDSLYLGDCFHIHSFVHFVIHTEWWYLIKFFNLMLMTSNLCCPCIVSN